MNKQNLIDDKVAFDSNKSKTYSKNINNESEIIQNKNFFVHNVDNKYKRMFENSLDAIIQIDKNFKLTDSNISASLLFGYEDINDFIFAIDNVKYDIFSSNAKADVFFDILFKNKKIKLHEVEMIRRDGSKFTALISMCVTVDSKTNMTFFEGSIIDISDLKKNEEIERARETTQRTLDFTNLFLSNMSHEILTPLNAIIGMSGVLQTTTLLNTQSEYVQVIETASRNLHHLINEILCFSQIESGKMQLSREILDIEAIIDDIISLFSVQATKKNIELEADIADDVPKILFSDQARLRQVMINLLSNAFKFTDHGKISIRVFVKERRGEKYWLQFEISDTGIGIPPDKRNGLFDAFQQIDNSITRKYGGTGLGLSISKKIVEMLGGSIWIDPDCQKGSTFCFTSPFSHPDELDIDVSTSSKIENVSFQSLSGKHILLVEDNEFNQMVALEVLKTYGVLVVVAENGKIAVDLLLEGGKFDLILMDIQMPTMDGFEATRIIRQELKMKHLPIVAMTAHVMISDRDKCIEKGMDAYLSKPIDRPKLESVLKKFLT